MSGCFWQLLGCLSAWNGQRYYRHVPGPAHPTHVNFSVPIGSERGVQSYLLARHIFHRLRMSRLQSPTYSMWVKSFLLFFRKEAFQQQKNVAHLFSVARSKKACSPAIHYFRIDSSNTTPNFALSLLSSFIYQPPRKCGVVCYFCC